MGFGVPIACVFFVSFKSSDLAIAPSLRRRHWLWFLILLSPIVAMFFHVKFAHWQRRIPFVVICLHLTRSVLLHRNDKQTNQTFGLAVCRKFLEKIQFRDGLLEL